jgi:hypothetical protein
VGFQQKKKFTTFARLNFQTLILLNASLHTGIDGVKFVSFSSFVTSSLRSFFQHFEVEVAQVSLYQQQTGLPFFFAFLFFFGISCEPSWFLF